MMNFLQPIIDFFTDPKGLGFPILIAAGLGVILWLMNYTSHGWRRENAKSSGKKEEMKDRNLPFKPF